MVGISNITNLNISDITTIANVGGMPELMHNVNNTIYGGWFFYIMLWILCVIFYVAMSSNNTLSDKPLVKAMLTFAGVTLIALPLRILSLVSDFQMWTFPLLAIIIAMVLWAIGD